MKTQNGLDSQHSIPVAAGSDNTQTLMDQEFFNEVQNTWAFA